MQLADCQWMLKVWNARHLLLHIFQTSNIPAMTCWTKSLGKSTTLSMTCAKPPPRLKSTWMYLWPDAAWGYGCHRSLFPSVPQNTKALGKRLGEFFKWSKASMTWLRLETLCCPFLLVGWYRFPNFDHTQYVSICVYVYIYIYDYICIHTYWIVDSIWLYNPDH